MDEQSITGRKPIVNFPSIDSKPIDAPEFQPATNRVFARKIPTGLQRGEMTVQGRLVVVDANRKRVAVIGDLDE